MPTNLLPVAACTAVTVTPGSTAPVVSVTVPVSTASCADTIAGSAAIAMTHTSRLRTLDHIGTSSQGHRTHAVGNKPGDETDGTRRRPETGMKPTNTWDPRPTRCDLRVWKGLAPMDRREVAAF